VEERLHIFKSFEEQERFFLNYFMNLSPSERLLRLADLQKKNFSDFLKPAVKKITVRKHYFANGY